MARIEPLSALRYDLATVGSLDDVTAPPYDVIDDADARGAGGAQPVQRRRDRPAAHGNGDDPYLHAQTTFEAWQQQGVLVREREPSLWVLTQDYALPGGERRTRHGFFCRVSVEDYGPGPHPPARAHAPGPEGGPPAPDTGHAGQPLPHLLASSPTPRARRGRRSSRPPTDEPFGEATDADGTVNRLWRVGPRRDRGACRRRWPTPSC